MNTRIKAVFFASSLMAGAMNPVHAETNPNAHDHGSMAQDDEGRGDHMIEGIGSIVAINASTHRVGLDHAPVPALNWPAMRMAFTVSENVDLGAFKKGDKVQFTLTIDDLPTGTKTAKQMVQGGKMIVNTLKSVIETGRPSFGTRLLYFIFGLMAPFTPAKCKSEHWPVGDEGGGS